MPCAHALLRVTCYQDEDMVGRMKKIYIQTNGKTAPRASLQRRDSQRKRYEFCGKQRVRYETETPSPQIVLKEDVTEGLLPRASNVGCEQAEFKTRKRNRDAKKCRCRRFCFNTHGSYLRKYGCSIFVENFYFFNFA